MIKLSLDQESRNLLYQAADIEHSVEELIMLDAKYIGIDQSVIGACLLVLGSLLICGNAIASGIALVHSISLKLLKV